MGNNLSRNKKEKIVENVLEYIPEHKKKEWEASNEVISHTLHCMLNKHSIRSFADLKIIPSMLMPYIKLTEHSKYFKKYT